MFAIREAECNLRFLVHPELSSIVCEDDLIYLESLLRDFRERAKLHPEALFKQLCSLGSGPLVAQEVGPNFRDRPTLQELSSTFVQV